MMKYSKELISILTLLLLFSCMPVQFDKPLTPIDEAKPDKRLEGVWRLEEETEKVYLHIISKKSGLYDFIMILTDESEFTIIYDFEMFSSKITNESFMNLRYVVRHGFKDILDIFQPLSKKKYGNDKNGTKGFKEVSKLYYCEV